MLSPQYLGCISSDETIIESNPFSTKVKRSKNRFSAFVSLAELRSYTPLFFRLTHEAGATSMIGKRSYEKCEGRKRKAFLFEIQ